MAGLIKMVAGGYKVVETEQFIPAEHLIPFGISTRFKGDTCARCNVKLKSVNLENEHFPLMREEIVQEAQKYAEGMGAPFYQLKFNETSFFLPRFFIKKAHFVSQAEIQLYVENSQSP